MNSRIIVIENDKKGTSKVSIDSTPKPFFESEDGHKLTELWFSDQLIMKPCIQDTHQEIFSLNLKQNEKRFIQLEIPPFSKIQNYIKKNGVDINESLLSHSTSTIDFAVVVNGTVTLITENENIDLNPGDCVVQKCTVHSWINYTEDSAKIIFVMIGADVSSSFEPKHFDLRSKINFEYPPK